VRQRTLDIEAAAGVCSELARVLDPADLPALLARAAGVIGARGLIVWVADTAGSMLFPTLSVGYTPGALERMGGIRRDADNAAAAAYRHGDVQVVPARNGGPGAIVAPIVATDGCVGVLAAEVATGDEDEMDRRAVASILAAQLATIVTAVPEERQALRSMDSGWAAG
jgi:GAF domain-containing protein